MSVDNRGQIGSTSIRPYTRTRFFPRLNGPRSEGKLSVPYSSDSAFVSRLPLRAPAVRWPATELRYCGFAPFKGVAVSAGRLLAQPAPSGQPGGTSRPYYATGRHVARRVAAAEPGATLSRREGGLALYSAGHWAAPTVHLHREVATNRCSQRSPCLAAVVIWRILPQSCGQPLFLANSECRGAILNAKKRRPARRPAGAVYKSRHIFRSISAIIAPLR